MSDKPFDPAKPVRTRDGRAARIICTDKKDKCFPIVALVTCNGGVEFTEHYTRGGLASDYGNHTANDLINVEPRVEEYYDVWDSEIYGPYSNLVFAWAVSTSVYQRLCILKVVREGDKIISREVVND